MLELDDNYFKEEERCGFKIPSMMKRVWAVEMDVLTHRSNMYGIWTYILCSFWDNVRGGTP